MALKKPNEKAKPTLVCVGTIGTFGDVVQSKTEGSPYYMEKVDIRPSGEGEKASFRFMWAPEFFAKDFDPSRLDKGETFVYKKNIASLDGASLLEGLCGSDDSWEAVQAGLVTIENDIAIPASGEDRDAARDAASDAVDGIFAEHFANQGPVPFIYVLKQERKKDGEDAEGKARYVRGKYYEVDEILHLTEKNVKALVKRYEKNETYAAKRTAEGKEASAPIKFLFDPTDYGLDTEVPQSAEPAWV